METKTGDGEKSHMKLVRDLDGCGVEIGWAVRGGKLTSEDQMNLTDGEIAAEMAAGRLVRNGEPAQLGPACYELRMGLIYYDLTERARRFDVGEGGKALIKPGHRVVLITHEELIIPPDIIARIIRKSSRFYSGWRAIQNKTAKSYFVEIIDKTLSRVKKQEDAAGFIALMEFFHTEILSACHFLAGNINRITILLQKNRFYHHKHKEI